MAKVRMNAIAFGTFAGAGGIYHFNPKSEDTAARFPVVEEEDVAQAKSRGLGEDLSDAALRAFKLKEDPTSFESLWERAMANQLEAEAEAGVPESISVGTTALNQITEIAFPAGDKAYGGNEGLAPDTPPAPESTVNPPSDNGASNGSDSESGNDSSDAQRIAGLNVGDLGSEVSGINDAVLLNHVLEIENAKTQPRVTAVNAITARLGELANADPDAPPVS